MREDENGFDVVDIGNLILQSEFDRTSEDLRTKMFDILRKVAISYRERRVIYNMYHNQGGSIRVEDQDRIARIKMDVRQGCNLSPLLFNLNKVFLSAL